MNAATIENATIPTTFTNSEEESIVNARINDLKMVRVIFFPENVIPSGERFGQKDLKGFGGIYRPDIQTLKHNHNPGMIYKCALTPLKPKMIDSNRGMLDPKDVPNWETSYTLKNSKYDPVTNTWGDETIGASKNEEYLVYKHRYPGEEIPRVLEKHEPNGEGGIVEVAALKGASSAEIREAQLYFFPNWDDVRKGQSALPTTLDGLESHLRDRRRAVNSELWDADRILKFQSIGDDLLRSCMEYRSWGMQFLKTVEDDINFAKLKGFPYSYPPKAEMLLAQLGQRRKDDIVTGEDSATRELVGELREEREAKVEQERKMYALEERKQYLAEVQAGLRERDEAEEIRLGIKKASDSRQFATPQAPTVEELVADGVGDPVVINSLPLSTEVRLCGRPTANGECKRELKAFETECWQHK